MSEKKEANKSEIVLSSPQRVSEASDVLKGLANPTRLCILCQLETGEMPVSEIAELTGQSLPAISQHLTKMRLLGLVESERRGKEVYYRCAGGVGRSVIDALCLYFREQGLMGADDSLPEKPAA